MDRNIALLFEPEGRKIRTIRGKRVFDIARENGLLVRSECGGRGTCGKCRVIVHDPTAVSRLESTERRFLRKREIQSGFRLACQVVVNRGLVVTIPEESRITARRMQFFGKEREVQIEEEIKKFYLNIDRPTLKDSRSDFERLAKELEKQLDLDKEADFDFQLLKELPDVLRHANWKVTTTLCNKKEIIALENGDTSDRSYGLAIDVGTSKIVVHIVNLKTGLVLGAGAIENPQMMFGEDIISRATYAIENSRGLLALQKMVIAGTNNAIDLACKKANADRRNIYAAVFVGNTVMHHLFFGLQPRYLSLSPYCPVLNIPLSVKARDIGLNMCPSGVVHSLPLVAGFVGADAVADVLATGIHEKKEESLLLDIGTNTEVFLGNTFQMHACSCASGPAFEGVHVRNGVKSVDGAIESLSIDPLSLRVEYKTINDAPPVGICGTGIIDAVAEMFKCGVINAQGRFTARKNPRIKGLDSEKRFVLVPKPETQIEDEIVITQKDVSEIQLAKSAIFTGCSILLRRTNMPIESVDKVFISGAFGERLNLENAKVLGLIPDVPSEKVEFVGNTAIVGARMALLSNRMIDSASNIARKTTYVELAADPYFAEEFAKALLIPHRELNRFPSVRKLLGKRLRALLSWEDLGHRNK